MGIQKSVSMREIKFFILSFFCEASFCPVAKFYCPNGDITTVASKWYWRNFKCVFESDLDEILTQFSV